MDQGILYHPALQVLIHPRDTIRRTLGKYGGWTLFLGGMGTAAEGLDVDTLVKLFQSAASTWILVLGLVLAFMLGLLLWVVSAALLRLTGSWLGGQANFTEVRYALAWSTMPSMLALLINLLFMGPVLLPSAGNPGGPQTLFGILNFALAVWALVLFLGCLSEVQRFSVWRVLGSSLVALLLLAIPFLILGLLAGVAVGV
ncbi:MAG: YIP1 family protein [Candidatus Omnitrophica bacterium]|nr:YIP1 family protein [Candidatus Omnitrophota bacterium]